MKKFLYISTVIAAGLWLSSCADDIGNYSYTDINEVSVDSTDPMTPEEGKTYDLVAFVDYLDFDPKIQSTFGITDDSNYEYEWRIMPSGVEWGTFDESEITVCTTRKIHQLVTLDPKKYAVYFNVKDKSTGVTWTTSFFLQVRSLTNEGWLILSDVNDKCRIDIVYNRNETEDLIARDIFQEQEFDPGKPEKLIFNYRNKSNQATILVTDKDSYCLDPSDLHAGEDNSMIWKFGMSPESVKIKASVISMYAGRNLWAIIDGNDDLYTIELRVDGSYFEFPLTRLNGETAFKPAPFIGVNLNNNSWNDNMYGGNPVMMYDETNRQFLMIHNNSTYPSVMDFTGTKLFDNPTGRDMVFMESTRHGAIKSVLRDPSTKETYFYSIILRGEYQDPENWWEEGDYISYNEQDDYGKINGPGVETASLFAFHHLWNYLFYVSGNTVYQFNLAIPDEAAVPVLSFPGEEIKVLKFNPFIGWESYADWERERGYQLIVGTTTPGSPADDCGTVRFYEVPNLMGPLKEVKKYDGFGDIVDVIYKERYSTE